MYFRVMIAIGIIIIFHPFGLSLNRCRRASRLLARCYSNFHFSVPTPRADRLSAAPKVITVPVAESYHLKCGYTGYCRNDI